MDRDIVKEFKNKVCSKCTEKEKCEGFVETLDKKIRCINRDIVE